MNRHGTDSARVTRMGQPMTHGSQDAFRYPVARSRLMTYETSQTLAPSEGDTQVSPSGRRLGWNKVPEVTAYFWVIKVLCTTVGETAADLLNEKAGLGLTGVSVLMSALLAVVLVVQFRTTTYRAGCTGSPSP